MLGQKSLHRFLIIDLEITPRGEMTGPKSIGSVLKEFNTYIQITLQFVLP